MSTIVSRANKPAIFVGALLLLMFVLPIARWAQVLLVGTTIFKGKRKE